jgi:hypothetical protein
MPELKRRLGPWTYAEAVKALPYVRPLLGGLREHFVAFRHFYRLSGFDPDSPRHRAKIVFHREEGMAVLEELGRLCVAIFASPLRGVALFRFEAEVQLDEFATAERIACWVYRDTREGIDSIAFAEDLYDTNDLLGSERPIPAGWETASTFFLPLFGGLTQP